jgi:hypothetical protein
MFIHLLSNMFKQSYVWQTRRQEIQQATLEKEIDLVKLIWSN